MALIRDIQDRREAVLKLICHLREFEHDHFNDILIPRVSVVLMITELRKLEVRLRHALEVEQAEEKRAQMAEQGRQYEQNITREI